MTSDHAWLQLFVLILYGGVILFAIEAVLWWYLRRWHHQQFWWGVGVTAIVLLSSINLSIGAPLLSGVFGWSAALLVVALGAFCRRIWRGRLSIAIMMLTPAFLVVALLVIYPFFFQLRLAFSNLNMFSVAQWIRTGELRWVGLDNFYAVFSNQRYEQGSWEALIKAPFWILLARTLLWTAVNVLFHVGFGLGLAMLLNRDLWGKGVYRTLLIVPWAMPQVVAVLAWRGEFHPEFGLVNHLIQLMGFASVQWWSSPVPIFISCCIVNIWLGIPFMLIVFLGGLGSIPKSYYEAAAIDGASLWSQFKEITLPMLKPVVVPSVTLGTIWTFNNVNVIYLMTGQDGGTESADILVSALYKAAFTYSRFSYAAAFAAVVFAVLILITLGWFKVSKASEAP